LAQDIFLKLTGITGESQDDKHTNEIEVLRWDWKINQQSSMHSGSGGGSGKATVNDLFSITTWTERAQIFSSTA